MTTTIPTPGDLARRSRPPARTDRKPLLTDQEPMPFRQRYELAVRNAHHLDRYARLVAYTIATWADWETGTIPPEVRPGLERIGVQAGLTEFLVRTAVRALVDAGFIRRIPGATSAQPSTISLLIPPGSRLSQ